MTDKGNQPIFDRGRITHGESKRSALIGMRLKKAEADNDIEMVEKLLEEVDTLIAKTIVYIPQEWFVPEAPVFDVITAEALDFLPQNRYEELMAAAQPKQAGEPAA